MNAAAIVVFYCAPFTCAIVALDIAAADVPTYRERLARGAFVPRCLYLARPECFRPSTREERNALRVAGALPHYVHAWCEADPTLLASPEVQS